MLLLGARGKLTRLCLVFQETGAAEQHGCDRPGAAAVPPSHRPADHEGECVGDAAPARRCCAGLWARGPAEVPVLETEAGEERHFQRSGCTDLGCSRGSSSRWFLEFSLQRVQTPSAAAGRACQRAPSCAAAHVTQSRAAMPSRMQNPSAVILLITLPGRRGGRLLASTRQTACPRQAGTAGRVRPTARSCQDHSAAAFCHDRGSRSRDTVLLLRSAHARLPLQGSAPLAVFPNPTGEGHEQPGQTWKLVLLEPGLTGHLHSSQVAVISLKQSQASGEHAALCRAGRCRDPGR